MKARRHRADSATAAVKAMVSAALPDIQPPAHVTLRSQDGPFWVGIVSARARDEWTPADLAVGAQLARCQADMEREQTALDAEGSVILNRRGTPLANPRFTVLQQLAQREMALMRALRLNGTVASKDLNARRGIERAARKVRGELAQQESDESLLM